MSHTSQLQKEIDYWTVLIQKHKKNMNNTDHHNNTSNSKYSWRRPAMTTASHASEVQSRSNPVANYRKRHLPDLSYTRHPPKKSFNTLPGTSGDLYKSKFKWTKPTTLNKKNVTAEKARVNANRDVFQNRQDSSIRNTSTLTPSESSNSSLPSLAKSQYKYIAPLLAKGVSDSKQSQQNPIRDPLNWNRKTLVQKRTKSSHTSFQSEKWRSRHYSKRKTNPYSLNRTSKHQLKPNEGKMSVQIGSKRFLKRRLQRLDSKPARHIYRNIKGGTHLNPHHITVKQQLANRVVKSHHAAKMRKPDEKQYCLYFGRFGKCMRGKDCKFIHDPSRVAVCSRDENCSYSHKLEKEKTPLCLHFLKGKCTTTNCPYLHVYLGRNAPICEKFAMVGYCPKADKCEKQHIKCCPEFFETGVCPNGKKCKLPHMAKKVFSAKSVPKRTHASKEDGEQSKHLETKQDKSAEDFLSLKVDSPASINTPFKGSQMKIKPVLRVKNTPKES